MKKPKGIILYRGASLIDGAPIVVIATLNSNNKKTGNMVQTWILRSDMHPLDAIAQFFDRSICGDCPHRARTCYVNVGQAPAAIYKAFLRGLYPDYDPALHDKYLQDRAIRFGAYGDPAAAPFSIWFGLRQLASVITGYSHQARLSSFDPAMHALTMTSADSPKQAAAYHAKGIRTFRVKNAEDGFLPNEIECLADSKGLNCIDCGLCDGGDMSADRPSIAITVHGKGASKFNTANIIATSAAA
jgi:hypothetical protein